MSQGQIQDQIQNQAHKVTREGTDDAFEIIAGAVCLDFANTVGGQRGGNAFERLHGYADLVRWGRQAEILSAAKAKPLLALAQQLPDGAETIMIRARALREAIYLIFAALADHAKPPAEPVALLNGELSLALSRLGVTWDSPGFVWQWRAADDALDVVLWPVARSAAELLVSPEAHSVRQCANPTCSWLFLDTSRNHSRRWCDMRGCGNRAKVRRHRARAKGSDASSH